MVAHCIEDFFGVGVKAWPMREGRGQCCRTIVGELKNLRLMSHQIAPTDSYIDGAVEYFCVRIEAVRGIHIGSLMPEGIDPLDI